MFQVSCRNASFTFTLTRTVYPEITRGLKLAFCLLVEFILKINPEIARGLELAFCLLVECHNNNAQI